MESPAGPGAAPTVPDSDDAPEVATGVALGRFVIEGTLGAGGMGIVFAAHDPVLDRRVAVKLMRWAAAGTSGDARRARFLREAQALARLTHPNVVTVYDAGADVNAVFIAMELVDGGTLREWMAKPHAWREVVDVFVAAGRGLAAAHAAGLIHRDFKPANVFIDRQGGVKVGDFGLVGLSNEEPPPATAGSSDRSSRASLTETGDAMGTPEYMAPEQARGARVDALADQYAFCVSLYEALCGERPSVASAGAGRPLARRGTPGWLIRAVVRGLARNPEDRHPSMAALVDILERTPTRRRRTAVALVTTIGLVGALVGGWLLSRGGDASAVHCDRAGDSFATAWNDQVRAGVQRSLAAAPGYGADSAARAAASIDRYGERWRAARVDACVATHQRGEQSPELLDRRMRCLDQELAEVRAVLDVLASASGDLVERAPNIIGALPDPAACNATRLSAAMAIPEGPQAEAILDGLTRLRALRVKGDWTAARPLATSLRADAEALGHPGLRAAVLGEYAMIIAADDPQAARTALEQALADAARAGDRDLEAIMALRMLENAYNTGERQPIEALLPVARAAVARDGVTAILQREFHETEAHALGRLGRTDDALAACERIVPFEEESRMRSTNCRCAITMDVQRNDEALEHCRAALAATEHELGPTHPFTGARAANLANVLGRFGNNEESLALGQRAVDIFAAAYGADSIELPPALRILAHKLMAVGRLDEARVIATRSLAIREKASGQSGRQLALEYSMLGEIEVRSGEHATGVAHLEKALRMTEEALGADHPSLAAALFNFGEAMNLAGRPEAGLTAYRRCSALVAKTQGAEHFLRGACLTGEARSLIALGRARPARPLAEQGLAIVLAAGVDPQILGVAHHTLGSALAGTADPSRARGELEKAIAIYRGVGAAAAHDLKSAERELAALPR